MPNTTKLLEDVEKRFDEKFLPKQDRAPYYIEFNDAKTFIAQELALQQQAHEANQRKQDIEMLRELERVEKDELVLGVLIDYLKEKTSGICVDCGQPVGSCGGSTGAEYKVLAPTQSEALKDIEQEKM